jgi:hypothetical protein
MENWLAPLPGKGEIVVLQSPPRDLLLSLVAALALNGPLLVLDAGNQFDAYRLARLIRRQTADLYQVLEGVRVSRAFTCYQVVALFEQLPLVAMPHVIFDLPATFYDESVTAAESHRLLRIALYHVRRVSRVAPMVISVRPPHSPQRVELLAAVVKLADQLLTWEASDTPAQLRLFP